MELPHWDPLRNIVNNVPCSPSNAWSYNEVHFWSNAHLEAAEFSLSCEDSKARRWLVILHPFARVEKRTRKVLPSTQDGWARVVPATCPGKQEHLTVCDRSSMRFLLQHLCTATTSQVPCLIWWWPDGLKGRKTDPVLSGKNEATKYVNDTMTTFSSFLHHA